MSSIRNPFIFVPDGVEVSIKPGVVEVSHGSVSNVCMIPDYIKVEPSDVDKQLYVQGSCEASMLGLYKSKINNTVLGVKEPFSVVLEINGIGYKANLSGSYLELFLGFSHGIKYKIPDYLSVKVVKPTEVIIYSIDKEKLNIIADDICTLKRFDPYKRKGISKKGKYRYTKEMNKK